MGNTQQITVFTPTYNREKLLWRVFESLQKQTDNNFRWLIVDDGSCDATRKAVALMMEKSAFNIEYIYQVGNTGRITRPSESVKQNTC